MSEDRPQEPCCFDDWVDHWWKQAKKKETASGVTAPLLDALAQTGIRDRTVLDVGCGIGDLAIAAVGRGAMRAEGFDLSTKAIDTARRLASDRGVADRTTFEVGDGAEIDLPPADVVVLNRVLCCYPNADGLLEHSLAAARHVYAFTAPVSSGLMGGWMRMWSKVGNAWYGLRKKKFGGFRVHIHDLDRIDERVRAAGFRRERHERRRFVWQLAVYARP